MTNSEFYKKVEDERKRAKAAHEFFFGVIEEKEFLAQAQVDCEGGLYDADKVLDLAAKLGGIGLYLKSQKSA